MTLEQPYAVPGRRILVMGLARSGLAAARLCAAHGAEVVATDRREASELDTALLAGTGVKLELGGHDPAAFEAADLVVVSPGVPLSAPEIQRALAAGVPVIGEVELAASFLVGLPVVGITGTNGKSTTTALVGRILEAAGLRPFVGGNIGRALSEAALASERPGALVLELSSFQLETIRHLHPQVALLLNLTPDHLDRHGDLAGYGAAKRRIFMNQTPRDVAVVNADDPEVSALADGLAADVRRFSIRGPVDGGCGVEDGHLVLATGGGPVRLRVDSPSLRGPHNLANAAAAALAAQALGVPPAVVQSALDGFKGLPHRLERLRVRGGVEWINDSKATNLESAATALRAFDGQVIWIAGGRGKGASYAPLAELVRGRVKALLGIGEDGPALVDALGAETPVAEDVGTLEAAVARAAALAAAGDVVLLSPACASYDQFRDYEHRGAELRRLVEALP